MSRILDFYGVRWEYEPHTFPILWNLDGDVVESFSPDFYLADLDLCQIAATLGVAEGTVKSRLKITLPQDDAIFPVVEDVREQYFELWGV